MRFPAKDGLPPFSLRENPRSRRVTLRLTPGGELRLTVPPGFDPAMAHHVVEARRDWIERCMDKLGRPGGSPPDPPDELRLRAADESWRVDYAERGQGPVRLRTNAGGRLLVSGGLADRQAVRRALLDFCRARGRDILPGLAEELAREAGEDLAGVTVRAQRSRWGSCSSRGSLSLNAKLLFLPQRVAVYVIRHELAHLRHLNHSPAFWERVTELEPDWRAREKELKESRFLVPGFLG
ncbi:M48 family metallopeptidase [Desulfohalovibrio reitneri]|uniref:M48 family metallopeptidase n=1 Tax=Desulfohalovibrio reitneri TaxID=1307759 RepID=UPI0005541927|nr:SprT family zinc-dependent metalloprotease [Desulfohalovibrio reitneri]